MNWNLAVENNREALKRILATLVAMVGMGEPGKPGVPLVPRHLHRFVLSLLRPAESATRRLIIVAARGLAVKLPKPRAEKSEQSPPRPDPRVMPEWARLRLEHGLPIEFPRGEPIPLWAQETPEREQPVRRPRVPFFPMFDPMKRFDRKSTRRRIPEDRMPRIALLNDDGWSIPRHLRRAPPPPPPAPDDLLDAGRLYRRLDAIGAALDDLPRQAQRFARWRARRDARMAAEREKAGHARQLHPKNSTSPSREATLVELGLTPEAIALLNRSNLPGRTTPPNISTKPRRFIRIEPMRPGRPPGWRRKPTHEIHEILNDLHGLAVWARDGHDTS